jgi:hypothetical protein
MFFIHMHGGWRYGVEQHKALASCLQGRVHAAAGRVLWVLLITENLDPKLLARAASFQTAEYAAMSDTYINLLVANYC